MTYTLKKRNRVISRVKTKYRRTTHKYGLRLTKNVTESIHIDQANVNTYRKDSIDKEMNMAKIAYEPREY